MDFFSIILTLIEPILRIFKFLAKPSFNIFKQKILLKLYHATIIDAWNVYRTVRIEQQYFENMLQMILNDKIFKKLILSIESDEVIEKFNFSKLLYQQNRSLSLKEIKTITNIYYKCLLAKLNNAENKTLKSKEENLFKHHLQQGKNDEWYVRFIQKINDEFKSEMDVAKMTLTKPEFYSFITEIYQDKVLKIEDEIYPVYIYCEFNEDNYLVNDNINQIMQKDNNSKLSVNDTYDPHYFNGLQSGNLMLLDNNVNISTLAMNKIEIQDGNPKIYFNTSSSYFRGQETSGALEWEIRTSELNLDNMPLRKLLHSINPNPYTNGSGRHSLLGVSSIIIYWSDKENCWKFFIKYRAKKGTPLWRGYYHVLPSFMYQPTDIADDDDLLLMPNILREYGEEILGINEELIRLNEKVLYENRAFLHFKELLDSGTVGIIYSGVAINILDLRPEICTVIVFTNHTEYRANKSLWEINNEFNQHVDPNCDNPVYVNVNLDISTEELTDIYAHDKIVPPAIASIYLAKKLLLNKTPTDVLKIISDNK